MKKTVDFVFLLLGFFAGVIGNLSAIYTELEPDGLSMWWALDGDSPAASQLDGLSSEKLDKELLGKELHPLDGGDDLADEGDGGSGKGPDCSHVVLSAADPKSTPLGEPAALWGTTRLHNSPSGRR